MHFKDIGQSMEDHSVTFENGQARERTQVLMDIANQTGGMVIGTGDLSELALGWATYNGDHMSMYAVNAGIPKTLVRHLVSFVSDDKGSEDPKLSAVLDDILDTPVSPELLPAVGGKISQRTEDLVGPYELHDFFLYYAIRWGFSPKKVFRLAEYALGDRYDRAHDFEVAEQLLPPVLYPAVQALLPARRPQGGLRHPVPPGRLENAVGRSGGPVDGRAGRIAVTFPPSRPGPRRRRVQGFSPWAKTLPQGGFTPPEDFKYPGPHGTRSVSWGDWRMPSDAVAALWMEELESLH